MVRRPVALKRTQAFISQPMRSVCYRTHLSVDAPVASLYALNASSKDVEWRKMKRQAHTRYQIKKCSPNINEARGSVKNGCVLSIGDALVDPPVLQYLTLSYYNADSGKDGLTSDAGGVVVRGT